MITKLRIVGMGFSHAAIHALDRACIAAPSRLQYRLPRIHAGALMSVFFILIGIVKRADLLIGLVINIMFDLAGFAGGLLLIDPDRDKDFRQKLMTGINALRYISAGIRQRSFFIAMLILGFEKFISLTISIERTCPFLSYKTSIVSR